MHAMWFPRNEAHDNTVLWPIAFTSKSLKSAETHYGNIEREALGMLHGLKKFHHYCFMCEVNVITKHKLVVVLFKKDIASLSHRLQIIQLQIHQYNIRILYQ